MKWADVSIVPGFPHICQIARELHINVDTVRLWRDRWANWQENEEERSVKGLGRLTQRLQDTPRPGAIPKFTAEQRA